LLLLQQHAPASLMHPASRHQLLPLLLILLLLI
jgi:hypothetical protein